MTEASKAFDNTRTRFQRLSDARLFSGWVQSLSPSRVVVRCEKDLDMEVGESFHFEVHGLEDTALFAASLEGSEGNLFAFRLTSRIKRTPVVEDTRLRAGEVLAFAGDSEEVATGNGAEKPSECEVVDLSAKGMAVLLSENRAMGHTIFISLITPFGPVLAETEVRYCRAQDAKFRLGLRISSMSRLDRGRYASFLQSLSG